ncbi:MAG: carboxymuconolactone decarboxylase family protein [candidate division WOR-3 bacterium]
MKREDFERFWKERESRTGLVHEHGSLNTKRFFALDSAVYEDGALGRREKELMGLVASLVLRCQECINYHLKQCRDTGVSTEEVIEAMDVALIVGGSIVIPHMRDALETWLELQ